MLCILISKMFNNANTDQQRDHPGKCLYYARAFWLYLQNQCRLRKVALVCVLYVHNNHLTMALVSCVTSVAVAGKTIRAAIRMVMAMVMSGFMNG
jgi:hypothetical protein